MGANPVSLAAFAAMILTPLRGEVDAAIAALFPGVTASLTVVMTIWIAFLGYRIALGRGGEDSLRTLINGMVFAAAVGTAITAANYNAFIVEPALTVPPAIATALSGASPDQGAIFDQLFGRMLAAGERVLRSVSTWQFLTPPGVAIAFVVVGFWIVAGLAILAAFAIWLGTQAALYLTLAIGPLFLPMFLFSFFRGYAHRFIGVVVGVVVLDILITVLLALMLTTETQFLDTLRTSASSPDPLDGVEVLLAALAVFVLVAWMLKQIPGIAQHLAGGAYLQTQSLTGSIVGAVSSPARAVTRAITPPAAAGIVRINRPPGQSLGSSGP